MRKLPELHLAEEYMRQTDVQCAETRLRRRFQQARTPLAHDDSRMAERLLIFPVVHTYGGVLHAQTSRDTPCGRIYEADQR